VPERLVLPVCPVCWLALLQGDSWTIAFHAAEDAAAFALQVSRPGLELGLLPALGALYRAASICDTVHCSTCRGRME
jgi:hypothetical protein